MICTGRDRSRDRRSGGASGGAALRQGYLAVASGLVDVALVVGVEKFTDVVGPEVEAALATATDSDFEAIQGLTPTAQAALLMRRYMHEFNVPADGLAGFPLTAHANGVGQQECHVPESHHAWKPTRRPNRSATRSTCSTSPPTRTARRRCS